MPANPEQQLAALREAIASGSRRVVFRTAVGGHNEVEYRSLSEMRAIVADLEAQIAGVKPARFVYLRPVAGAGW